MPADHVSPQEIDLLRALKQAAVVLLLFLRARRQLNAGDVRRLLALDPKTTRDCLDELVSLGFLARTGKRPRYSLTAKGIEFPSQTLPIITITTHQEGMDFGSNKVISNTARKSEKTPLGGAADADLEPSLAALEAYGVKRNTRTIRLAQSLSPAVIHTTAAGLKQRYGKIDPGLLIYVLESNPADPPRNSEEGRRRYAEWESSGK